MTAIAPPAWRSCLLVVVVLVGAGCKKEMNAQITELVTQLETVDSWFRSLETKQHTAWFQRAVAWDIVLVTRSAWSAVGPYIDEPIDPLLRQGLDSIAAGSPTDYDVPSLVSAWRQHLGEGVCRIIDLTTDDQAWLKTRLALPALKDISADTAAKLAAYAKRASEAHDFVRIECGKQARLLVGTLGDRIVPILRE